MVYSALLNELPKIDGEKYLKTHGVEYSEEQMKWDASVHMWDIYGKRTERRLRSIKMAS